MGEGVGGGIGDGVGDGVGEGVGEGVGGGIGDGVGEGVGEGVGGGVGEGERRRVFWGGSVRRRPEDPGRSAPRILFSARSTAKALFSAGASIPRKLVVMPISEAKLK